jgi:hypothetical protein
LDGKTGSNSVCKSRSSSRIRELWDLRAHATAIATATNGGVGAALCVDQAEAGGHR